MTLLVITDLDGSLMEHESYSIEAASPALRELQQRCFPLIMNSSKTSSEIEHLQHELNLSAPFICENGAALVNLDSAIPGASDMTFGYPLSNWLDKVHEIRQREDYAFEGFSDWSPQRVSEITGLQVEEATRARHREFSEPILWNDSDTNKRKFEEKISEMDLQLLEGGRFNSIQGDHDKSNAMHWLREHFPTDEELFIVALGDSLNDEAMLNTADIAVIVKSPKSERIHLQSPGRIIRTSQPGPAGWNEAILEIIDLYDSNRLLTDTK